MKPTPTNIPITHLLLVKVYLEQSFAFRKTIGKRGDWTRADEKQCSLHGV